MNRLRSILLLIGLLLPTGAAVAAMSDYKEEFEINLTDDSFPTMEELEDELQREHNYYNRKYHTIWELTGDFDAEFYAIASTYGIREKRLKWDDEDQVLELLASIPKEMYPYIGPMLFEIPNMSDKVLNMPGIKETKHQFPKRIAPQLQDMEDLEFLSPYLYFLLMPEVWPENVENMEQPQPVKYVPKVRYNPEFYAAIKKMVMPEDYMPNGTAPKSGRSQMRTIHPDANTLLTSADVQAFIRTIPEVEEWYQQGENSILISRATSLLWSHEQKEKSGIVAGLKDLVNPCSRLVQKARLIGQELPLAKKVAGEGFTLNEWAYTCDKTVKAYRLSRISLSMMQTIRAYKMGLHEPVINKLSPHSRAVRYSTMQAIVSAYNAPLADMVEVRKNRAQLEKVWRESGFRMGNMPVRIE